MMYFEPTSARYSAACACGVGAGIGRQPAVEAGDAVPVRQGVDPVLQLVEDVVVGLGMDRVPARLHRTGAEVVGAR